MERSGATDATPDSMRSSSSRRRARLRLQRETLRALQAPDLRHAAGGRPWGDVHEIDDILPRTNAWTGTEAVC